MTTVMKPILKPLASLRLTVILMAIAMVLIFAGTWAQIDKGIWRVMGEYFRCWFTQIEFQIFLPRDWQVHGWIPWPGGYLIGTLLLMNLVAAHAVRFKVKARGPRLGIGLVTAGVAAGIVVGFHHGAFGGAAASQAGLTILLLWGAVIYLPLVLSMKVVFGDRTGIVMIHLALILLLVGEGVTGVLALETQMPIYEGQTTNWAHDMREVELAVVDHSDPDADRVICVPQAMLRRAAGSGRPISGNHLPFSIQVDRYMVNSRLVERPKDGSIPTQATHGVGLSHVALEAPEVSGVSAQSVNTPTAILSLSRDSQRLGRYLVSPHIQSDYYVFEGQEVDVGGKTFSIYLRFRRYYPPYTIKLTKFRHDLYTGTQIPKNFSSDIHLVNPSRNEERRVKIYMNHPFRYDGQTFYQSGWIPDKRGGPDRGTVLQVVENPGWAMPYMACTLGAVGLSLHFARQLNQFLRKAPA